MDIANNPVFYDDNYNEPFDILYPKKTFRSVILLCLKYCKQLQRKKREETVYSVVIWYTLAELQLPHCY